MIIGAEETASSLEVVMFGTNQTIIGPATSLTTRITRGSFIHVDDVALANIKAFSSLLPNKGYVAAAGGIEGACLEDVNEIVARSFPDAVVTGRSSKMARIPRVR